MHFLVYLLPLELGIMAKREELESMSKEKGGRRAQELIYRRKQDQGGREERRRYRKK